MRPVAGADASPAGRLMCACAEQPLGQGDERSVRDALAGPLDWEELTTALTRHSMLSLAYRRVSRLCPDAVPPAVLKEWRTATLRIARRSLFMQRQLIWYLDALAQEGAEALIVKGPALAQQMYGDSTVRSFCDLDVLVHPGQVAAAREAALKCGYELKNDLEGVAPAVLETSVQEIDLIQSDTGVALDVHWRLGPRFARDSLSAEDLFARAGRVSLLGREMGSIGPLDNVLLIAVHAASHAWPRFEDVAAVSAGLSRLDDAQAAELAGLAAQHDCRRRLNLAVLLAAVLAHAQAPAVLSQAAFADRTAKDLAADAAARLLWPTTEPTPRGRRGKVDYAKEVLWLSRTLDDRRTTARHLWGRLFVEGVGDWGEAAGPEDGGALAALVRRQRRLWGI